MKRYQARQRNGRFTRNTLENTFGLQVKVCPECRTLANCWGVNEPEPEICKDCGAELQGAASG